MNWFERILIIKNQKFIIEYGRLKSKRCWKRCDDWFTNCLISESKELQLLYSFNYYFKSNFKMQGSQFSEALLMETKMQIEVLLLISENEEFVHRVVLFI